MYKKQLLSSVAAVAILIGTGNLMPAKAGTDSFNNRFWSGWYAGGEVGWGRGAFRGVHQAFQRNSAAYPTDISRFLGGVHGGYNQRMNSYVVGFEADAMFMNMKKVNPGGNVTAGSNTFTGVANGLDLLASIRARLGYMPRENLMVFATGGLAYAKAHHTVYGSGQGPSAATVSLNGYGWVVGGGAEWAVNDIASLRIQGLYYIFNKKVNTFGLRVGSAHQSDYGALKDVFAVRAGISINLTNLVARK